MTNTETGEALSFPHPHETPEEAQARRREAMLGEGWRVYGEDRYNDTKDPSERRYLAVQFDEAKLAAGVDELSAAKHVVVVDLEAGTASEHFHDPRLMWSGQWKSPIEEIPVAEILADPTLQIGELLEWSWGE